MSESGVVTAVAPGTATITAVATNGTVGKEDDKTVSCTVAVNKADSAVKAAPAAKTLTSNGNAQELVTAGTADGGTMQYALGTDAATAPTTGYSASIPTKTDAGTYHVWYKARGDANHSDSVALSLPVTIKEDKKDSEKKESEDKKEDKKDKDQKQSKKKIPVKDLARAKYVRDKIRAIGTVTYTAACKARIDAARKAYNKLTPKQKKLVTNYKTLTNAEKKYDELKKGSPTEKKDGAEEEKITIPKTPAKVKAKAKGARVTVSWNEIRKTKKTRELRAKIQSIQVQAATDPEFKSVAAAKQIGKNRTKTRLNLQEKTTYFVRVRYVGADGFSNWSRVKKVKTK